MNKKLMLFTFLLLGVMMLVSCAPDFNSEELQSLLVDANSKVVTYSVEMSMNTIITTNVMDEEKTVTSTIYTKGDIDRNNKKLALTGTISSEGNGMKTEQEIETYITNGTLYSKTMNVWTKMTLDQTFWEQQDQVKQMVEMISKGEVEYLGDENINGNYYYIVKITPDLQSLIDSIQQQQTIPLELNFSEIIKNYTATIWVNKKNFIIEKSKTEMIMKFGEESSDNKMTMNSVVNMNISNINKEVNIVVPEAATNTMNLSEIVQQ